MVRNGTRGWALVVPIALASGCGPPPPAPARPAAVLVPADPGRAAAMPETYDLLIAWEELQRSARGLTVPRAWIAGAGRALMGEKVCVLAEDWISAEGASHGTYTVELVPRYGAAGRLRDEAYAAKLRAQVPSHATVARDRGRLVVSLERPEDLEAVADSVVAQLPDEIHQWVSLAQQHLRGPVVQVRYEVNQAHGVALRIERQCPFVEVVPALTAAQFDRARRWFERPVGDWLIKVSPVQGADPPRVALEASRDEILDDANPACGFRDDEDFWDDDDDDDDEPREF